MRYHLRTIIKVVLSFVLAATIISAAYAQPPPTLLWSDPVDTNDIALSADGQYVVVGTNGAVRFYGRSSPTPLWIYLDETDFRSVAISADGSYVAAGGYGSSGGFVFFWANAKSLTGANPARTWRSEDLHGPIDDRCLAISADGNYVAACGTGEGVYYWAGATGKSGNDIPTTWDLPLLASNVEAIAISDDGNHVAAAGWFTGAPSAGVLGYWNNAISLTGHPQQPTWKGQVSGERFVDVAISDDGNYVAVAGEAPAISTVYYWAGATMRTGTSEPYTWAGGVNVIFTSIDMSCDGDSVIAGAGIEQDESLIGLVYFWGGARDLTGTPPPSWTYPTSDAVRDVAINDAGTYMAAVDLVPEADTLHFLDRQGNPLWREVDVRGDNLSISCDGGTLAVGTSGPLTAYLFDTGYSSPCCGEVESVGGTVMSPSPMSGFLALLPWLLVAAVAVGAGAYVMRKRYASPLLARIK